MQVPASAMCRSRSSASRHRSQTRRCLRNREAILRSLRRLDDLLGLAAGSVARDLRLRFDQPAASIAKYHALALLVDVGRGSGNWDEIRSGLTRNGRLHEGFRTARGALAYARAFMATLDPDYLRRSRIEAFRTIIRVAAEVYLGKVNGLKWWTGPNPHLGGRTPHDVATNSGGTDAAIRAIAHEPELRPAMSLRRRKRDTRWA